MQKTLIIGSALNIYRMRKAGKTQQQIADALGDSQSTISKELSCNFGQRGYHPKQADGLCLLMQANKTLRSHVIPGALKIKVIERLKRNHMTRSVVGFVARVYRLLHVRASITSSS